jgi:3-methyladenine DNA glycosylase AlkD
LCGLFILIKKFEKSDEKEKIIDFYLKNLKLGNINNWDLVDLSCYKLLGDFLIDKEKNILYKLASSKNLWERRVSIVSCFAFIKEEDFQDALNISKNLLKDSHDLIHKAVGWMLREIGKRDLDSLKKFLAKNYKDISRTTLRYAIEKFPEEERKLWLKKI